MTDRDRTAHDDRSQSSTSRGGAQHSVQHGERTHAQEKEYEIKTKNPTKEEKQFLEEHVGELSNLESTLQRVFARGEC